jgi:hypothetical protein
MIIHAHQHIGYVLCNWSSTISFASHKSVEKTIKISTEWSGSVKVVSISWRDADAVADNFRAEATATTHFLQSAPSARSGALLPILILIFR